VQNLIDIDTFDNMKLSIFCPFGLKMPIHAPKIEVFLGGISPQNEQQNQTNHGTSLHKSASFEELSVKIRRRV